jgi:hypothetical protein
MERQAPSCRCRARLGHLFGGPRKERAAAGLLGDEPQHALALDRHARDAADGQAVDDDIGGLQFGHHLVHRDLAVLVVAVGHEHHRAPVRAVAEPCRYSCQRLQDRRAAPGADCGHRIGQRDGVARRSGDGGDGVAEGRHDGGVFRTQQRRQAQHRLAHEVHVARHALAAVDEQREGGGHGLRPHRVESLRDVVLEDAEVGAGQIRAVAPLGVAHRGVDVDADDLGGLDHFEGLEIDVVLDDGFTVGHLDADPARFERVLVGPLRRVRRSVGISGQELVADVEADRRQRVRHRDDARDDAHSPRQAAAAGGRGDLNRRGALRRAFRRRDAGGKPRERGGEQ